MERLEGSSDVKIVAVEGDRVYFCAMVAIRAGVKPVRGRGNGQRREIRGRLDV